MKITVSRVTRVFAGETGNGGGEKKKRKKVEIALEKSS